MECGFAEINIIKLQKTRKLYTRVLSLELHVGYSQIFKWMQLGLCIYIQI